VATVYSEFEWRTAAAANGRHGVALADKVLALVRQQNNVTTICDLGCGNGFTAGRLAQCGYEVTGVDGSESGIQLARSNYPNVEFKHALIGPEVTDNLGVNSYDFVISCDVIEHLYSPAALVECAFQILKPGGRFLLITPYHGYLKNLALALTGKLDSHFAVHHEGGHIKFFSVKTLSQLLKDQPFSNLEFSFYGRLPLLWMNMLCMATKS
jgi:2-polyprenyl-3-methyl-5-hydroxy-6-metoxy-1,4-benzoquinol methylase